MRLGSDPELFLVDASGRLKSVIDLVGGTKQAPKQIDGLPPGYTVQEDNVALELGIPPCSSATEYIHALQLCMNRALDMLPGLAYSPLSAASFPEEELAHPMASVFGCEPDFNAWTMQENRKPKAKDPNLRSAGGHIHVESNVDKADLVKAMDFFLSIPSVIMDKGLLRKKLYGKAGACRWKPYGVEHRVLSNFWVLKDSLIDWVWRNTARAEQFVRDGHIGTINTHADEIQRIINKNDVQAAQNMCGQFNLEVAQ